jgi:hypothetical protein
MKIAVLIYGRLNLSSTSYEYIINSLSNYDSVDFFCSSDNSDEIHLREFITKYKPLDYINDKINTDEHKYMYSFPAASETNIDSMIRHFINKNRVYNLYLKYIETHNKHYDIIMYLRADLKIYDKFDFQNPKENIIYIPEGNDWRHGVNDHIAYGNQNVMKIYSNLIYNCRTLLSNNLSYVHPETITTMNFKYNGLTIVRFVLKYDILRK